MIMCDEPNFIGICEYCGVVEGYAWERDDDPPDWANACTECGSEDIYDLEMIDSIEESKHEAILEAYQELADSSDYEDRLRAEGFIKALEVLI